MKVDIIRSHLADLGERLPPKTAELSTLIVQLSTEIGFSLSKSDIKGLIKDFAKEDIKPDSGTTKD